MKLVEINEKEFNELAYAEPNASFYQTSNWVNIYDKQNHSIIYLGYTNDQDVYSALGAFVIKKGSFLKKKTAICPFGFLINYYDIQLLKDFTLALNDYFSKKGVKDLTINPNVKYKTTKGNNDLLITKLKEIGYERINDCSYYLTALSENEKVKTLDDVYLNTYIASTDEQLQKVFKFNSNYQNIYNNMKDYISFVVCELDDAKSINKNTEIINTDNEYITMHLDDNKYATKIEKRKAHIESKQQVLNLLNKCVKENGNNPIVAITGLIKYRNKITRLFVDDKQEYRIFNTLNKLDEKTNKVLSNLECESFNSYTPTQNSSKIDLIGEFIYRIK